MSEGNIVISLLLTFIAGFATFVGSLVVISFRKIDRNFISLFLGFSAGVMIYLSFMEFLNNALKEIGIINSLTAFFLGMITCAIVDFLIPHYYHRKPVQNPLIDRKLLTTGLVVTAGIAIHNLFEGMAVFISTYSSVKHGVMVALAIAIHNLPEGIAIATPVYFATKNKLRTMKYSLFASMAEPLGSIIIFLLARPYLTEKNIYYVFSFVAGIMVFISFDELIPQCFKNGNKHTAIYGIIIGMIVMAISLAML